MLNSGEKGGELQGKAHSECDENGCGIKATINGEKTVWLQGKELVINADAAQDPEVITVTGTKKQIASAINSDKGYGVEIESGAKVERTGETKEPPTELNNTSSDIKEFELGGEAPDLENSDKNNSFTKNNNDDRASGKNSGTEIPHRGTQDAFGKDISKHSGIQKARIYIRGCSGSTKKKQSLEDIDAIIRLKAVDKFENGGEIPNIPLSVEEKIIQLADFKTKLKALSEIEQEHWKTYASSTFGSPEREKASTERQIILLHIGKLNGLISTLENEIQALQNGGAITEITDKFGKVNSNISDFRKVDTNYISFDQETILVDLKPPYIPNINEEKFKLKGYVFDAIRIDADTYILSTNDYKDENDNEYALLTLDQLVLVTDYYTTKAKANNEKEAESKNVRAEQHWDNLPEERRQTFLEQKGLYHSLPAKDKKKITFAEFEALTWQEKEKIHKFYKRNSAKRIVSKLEEDQMWTSFHQMYQRFVNPDAWLVGKGRVLQVGKKTGFGLYANPETFAYWRTFREMLNFKIKDIAIQRADLAESYQAAVETSFGESNTNTQLKYQYGILVKRQNGDPINPVEIEQVRSAWESVQKTFGNLKPNCDKYNIKVSHSGLKLIFSAKAIGVFIPTMGTIGVSNKYGDNQFRSTLAHEVGHLIDNFIGELNGKRWATDDYESTAGKIAFEFRNRMNKPKSQQTDYINATKECFARAFQQYYGLDNYGDEASIAHSYTDLGRVQPILSADNFVNKINFDTVIKPLIIQFLDENKEVFKYAVDINQVNELVEIGTEISESKAKFFGLEEPKNIEDVEQGVDFVLSQYASRPMGVIQVTDYLNENKELAKVFLEDHKISSKEQLNTYLNNRQSISRKEILAERKTANKEFESLKAEHNVSNIEQMAIEQNKEMEDKKAQSEHLEYKEAIKIPKGGAVDMTGDNLNAQSAEIIANKQGLRAEALYNWANKFNIDLPSAGHTLSNPKYNTEILDDILNDKYESVKKLIENIKEKPQQEMEVIEGKKIEPHKEVSTSVKSAIQDLIDFGKYSDLTLSEGEFLYSRLNNYESLDQEFDDEDSRTHTSSYILPIDEKGFNLIKNIIKSLHEKEYLYYFFYDDKDMFDYEANVYPKSIDFINAVRARIETRKNVKAGTDLFPSEANIPEFMAKGIYKDIKSCLLEDGDDQNDYLVEGTVVFNKENTDKEKWVVVEFYKGGAELKHLPKSKLTEEKSNRKLSFSEFKELFQNDLIEIEGINDLKTLNLCIKAIKKCIDLIDMADYKEHLLKHGQDLIARHKSKESEFEAALSEKDSEIKSKTTKSVSEAEGIKVGADYNLQLYGMVRVIEINENSGDNANRSKYHVVLETDWQNVEGTGDGFEVVGMVGFKKLIKKGNQLTDLVGKYLHAYCLGEPEPTINQVNKVSVSSPVTLNREVIFEDEQGQFIAKFPISKLEQLFAGSEIEDTNSKGEDCVYVLSSEMRVDTIEPEEDEAEAMRATIEGLQLVLPDSQGKEKKEMQATIDGLRLLLKDMPSEAKVVDSEESFGKGGEIKSPAEYDYWRNKKILGHYEVKNKDIDTVIEIVGFENKDGKVQSLYQPTDSPEFKRIGSVMVPNHKMGLLQKGLFMNFETSSGLKVKIKRIAGRYSYDDGRPYSASKTKEGEVKFEKGGEIPNAYEGKSPKEVWNDWTPEQRAHFFADHVSENYPISSITQSWDELIDEEREQITEHVNAKQYAKGGEIDSDLANSIESYRYDRHTYIKIKGTDFGGKLEFTNGNRGREFSSIAWDDNKIPNNEDEIETYVSNNLAKIESAAMGNIYEKGGEIDVSKLNWFEGGYGGEFANYKRGTIGKKTDGTFQAEVGYGTIPRNFETLEKAIKWVDYRTAELDSIQMGEELGDETDSKIKKVLKSKIKEADDIVHKYERESTEIAQ